MTEHIAEFKTDARTVQVGYKQIGEGKPVLLLHGIPGSSKCWDPVTEILKAKSRLIVPALLGFGKSSRSEDIDELWTVNQSNCVKQIADDLGIEKINVVGHDYGGPVALTMLAKNPGLIEKLVLISSNTFVDTPIPFPLSGIFWPIIGRAWSKFLFSRPSLGMMVKNGFHSPSRKPDLSNYLGDALQSKAIGTIFELL